MEVATETDEVEDIDIAVGIIVERTVVVRIAASDLEGLTEVEEIEEST